MTVENLYYQVVDDWCDMIRELLPLLYKDRPLHLHPREKEFRDIAAAAVGAYRRREDWKRELGLK